MEDTEILKSAIEKAINQALFIEQDYLINEKFTV